MPPVPGLTAASMIDLKGLARPEKFDGLDDHWLEWLQGVPMELDALTTSPIRPWPRTTTPKGKGGG
eukprot:11790330-Heterocapsa_arctica.AAC.1